jgi:hypothetical protein
VDCLGEARLRATLWLRCRRERVALPHVRADNERIVILNRSASKRLW